MLTKLSITNFKRFNRVEIPLGNPVVFIGPNNSGKTTGLQALSLWYVGLHRWQEKRGGKAAPENRPGVTINRRDLVSVPVPDANLLWRNLHVRELKKSDDGLKTRNVRIEIVVEGVSEGREWECGLEFDYANEESFYCRLLKRKNERLPIPKEALDVKVAFLPPMSGLTALETRLDAGAINVRIGEGRTAEVLRNLCYQIASNGEQESLQKWRELTEHVAHLFGVELNPPKYIGVTGEIIMSYQEKGTDKTLDLSSAGRGLHQTMLVLAYLYANPGSVLLLDEPDAHLEILRQRQIYQLLVDVARQQNCQIVAASHSEIVLNEAAERDVVIAFVGKPHRIDDRGSQVLKSLKDIGFDQYYQAEQVGWVLYLEGSTDLEILREFANRLNHPAKEILERPFVYYTQQPNKAEGHFYGLQDAKPDLVGVALFDRMEQRLKNAPPLFEISWIQREIENYLCSQRTLVNYAESIEEPLGPLFELVELAEKNKRRQAMENAIDDISKALSTLQKASPFSPDIKASEEFLEPLFQTYYSTLGLPNMMQKTNYHILARFVPLEEINPEIVQKLDEIVKVAKMAKPVTDE